jgi:hypothetical protein
MCYFASNLPEDGLQGLKHVGRPSQSNTELFMVACAIFWIQYSIIYSVLIFPPKQTNPITGLEMFQVFQEVQTSRLQDNRHTKVLSLPALRIGHLYSQETSVLLISVKWLSLTQRHSAAGGIKSMKNSNRTRGLPVRSAVPQPTAPPRAPFSTKTLFEFLFYPIRPTCSAYLILPDLII